MTFNSLCWVLLLLFHNLKWWWKTFNSLCWVPRANLRVSPLEILSLSIPFVGFIYFSDVLAFTWGATFNSLCWVPMYYVIHLHFHWNPSFNSLCWVQGDNYWSLNWAWTNLSIPFVGFGIVIAGVMVIVAIVLSIPFVGFSKPDT